MGKYLLFILIPLFCISATANDLASENDPNLAIGKLRKLHSKLPQLYVTNGVCTDPMGCDESELDQLNQISGNIEGPFDKSAGASPAVEPSTGGEESNK